MGKTVTISKTNTSNYLIRFGTLSALTLGAVVTFTGCQKSQDTQASQASSTSTGVTSSATSAPSDGKKLTVYASTNVWGSIAKAVGGDKVDVIMAVNDPTQDPHDYQASANDKLNVSKASLVLVNGGGYDDWTTSLAQSVDNKPVIINAVNLSGLAPAEHQDHDNHEAHNEAMNEHGDEHGDEKGHDEHAHDAAHEHEQTTAQEQEHGHDAEHEHHHHHGGFNEHVFFSLDTAKKVAQAVANELAQRDPANKATYAQNAQDFMQKIDGLKTKAQAVGQGKNLTAFATEPVTGYLLADMGIKDVTPAGFVEQSETDAGVSVKVLNDSKNLLNNKQASLLIVNAQTEDATSKQLVEIAKQAGVAVVPAYETFPQGVTSYTDFMANTIDSIAQAVK